MNKQEIKKLFYSKKHISKVPRDKLFVGMKFKAIHETFMQQVYDSGYRFEMLDVTLAAISGQQYAFIVNDRFVIIHKNKVNDFELYVGDQE
jgi:hypothetical protein